MKEGDRKGGREKIVVTRGTNRARPYGQSYGGNVQCTENVYREN